MEVKYIKDLRHNYMVILGETNRRDESYCIKMLRAEGLDGLLNLEQRSINNQIHYYYDITAKQTINNMFEKSAMTYSRIKKLFLTITGTIEKAYEYLLSENSFLLSPEMIFMDLTTDQVYLCYLPEYQMDIKEQMCSLIEYFMNKVDYSDKEAVLLIYNLYAAGKEEGFTFDHLIKVVHTSAHPTIAELERNNNDPSERKSQEIIEPISMKESMASPISAPFMIEKVSSEKEIMCYPWNTYLYTGISAIVISIILWLIINSKLIYNTLGTRIDISKLAASLLILFCIEGYLMKIIWDKKFRIAKVVSKQEYIDPRTEIKLCDDNKKGFHIKGFNRWKPSMKSRDSMNVNHISSEMLFYDKANESLGIKSPKGDVLDHRFQMQELPTDQQRIAESEEEVYNPTCLISSVNTAGCCYLKPVEEEIYEAIALDSFPFFIGKLKKHVDYCLEKDVVSRYHAKITKEQEQYYITDLNSTNGTFLNKEALQTYQPQELKNGDEIAFANIVYRFQIPR